MYTYTEIHIHLFLFILTYVHELQYGGPFTYTPRLRCHHGKFLIAVLVLVREWRYVADVCTFIIDLIHPVHHVYQKSHRGYLFLRFASGYVQVVSCLNVLEVTGSVVDVVVVDVVFVVCLRLETHASIIRQRPRVLNSKVSAGNKCDLPRRRP